MIETFPLRLPLATEYRWAKGVQTERRGVLVRAVIDGAEGWGECAPPIHLDTDPEAMAAEVRALVAGLDEQDDGFLATLDARAPHMRFRCGIASAWLSARAAARNLSLSTLVAQGAGLPPPATTVPINGLVTEKTPGEAATRAAALVAEGFHTIKVKCWDDRKADLTRVAAIRAAAPDVVLRLDANESWNPAWVREHMAALAIHRIAYVEQPVPSTRPLAEIAAFRASSPIPVALDESTTDPDSLAAIIAHRAADHVILKTQRAGGPDRAARMIQVARAAGMGVTVTQSLESAVGVTVAAHVAAMLPKPIPDCGLAMGRFLARDVAISPPVLRGTMDVPPGPGLGLTGVSP
jgi:o-succinylbenzoate synthase